MQKERIYLRTKENVRVREYVRANALHLDALHLGTLHLDRLSSTYL